MNLKEFKCRKSFYDKVDPCKPKNLLNKFYWNDSTENNDCTENMHGTTVLLQNSNCSWYDSKTNKTIKTNKPNNFIKDNQHHKPDEPQKIYIWKSNQTNKKKNKTKGTRKTTTKNTTKSIQKKTTKSTRRIANKENRKSSYKKKK